MECYAKKTPKGHTTSNRHLFDGDITLIRQRENIDEFPGHFDLLFRCNFDEQKTDVVGCFDVLSLL